MVQYSVTYFVWREKEHQVYMRTKDIHKLIGDSQGIGMRKNERLNSSSLGKR